MSDDEDYNSEEDQDYVPSEGEQVSEEENSGDDEDLSVLQDDDTSESKATKKRKKSAAKKNVIEARKRRGGIKLQDKNSTVSADDSEVIESEEEIKRKKELAEQIAKEEEERKKEKEKKRADDLWSSFMSGVKPPPRASTGSGTTVEAKSASEGATTIPESQTEKAKKVTITKVFDFAGETIKVTKEVDADSKEAKAEQKKQETANQETANPADPLPTSSLSQGLKRPAVGGGLGSVLNKINKKNKMGTLEKSKIDWESFKKKEGIDDDLKIYNKGKQGYTERMAFLNRADQRQYEIERNLRLGSTSKR
ncbi:craniofacial development protein 1-like [Physella acuta]|uniref:craniofacial development protein 1-like n=1 Tax=Physella acuta TaxID=109671 RepID=UPI0027DE9632|nr:craniofacial development protein 1-like [Physella acuta]